ncbi:MAG: hypothetical protein Q9169_000901 [Polycauliona sp. 2 TL-2023]
MSDPLTQLQDCLDQLATQFYASLRYLSTHHSSVSTLPPNPHIPPFPATDTNPLQRPDTPTTFANAQRELATDLVEKVKEIEQLTGTLPGLGKKEESQVERIRELEEELRRVEDERKGAVREREECLERLEELIGRVAKVES